MTFTILFTYLILEEKILSVKPLCTIYGTGAMLTYYILYLVASGRRIDQRKESGFRLGVVVGESRSPVLQLPIGAESLNSHTLVGLNVLAWD